MNRCKWCKFFHELKWFKDGEFEIMSVCTLFPQTEKGYDAFALVVDEMDLCECFSDYREVK